MWKFLFNFHFFLLLWSFFSLFSIYSVVSSIYISLSFNWSHHQYSMNNHINPDTTQHQIIKSLFFYVKIKSSLFYFSAMCGSGWCCFLNVLYSCESSQISLIFSDQKIPILLEAYISSNRLIKIIKMKWTHQRQHLEKESSTNQSS